MLLQRVHVNSELKLHGSKKLCNDIFYLLPLNVIQLFLGVDFLQLCNLHQTLLHLEAEFLGHKSDLLVDLDEVFSLVLQIVLVQADLVILSVQSLFVVLKLLFDHGLEPVGLSEGLLLELFQPLFKLLHRLF